MDTQPDYTTIVELCTFKGTPTEFQDVLTLDVTRPATPLKIRVGLLHAMRTSIVLLDESVPSGSLEWCEIMAILGPKGTSRIVAELRYADWSKYEPTWQILHEWLQSAGWVHVMSLDELLDTVLNRHDRMTKAWWRELVNWYRAGGSDSIKVPALAEKLDLSQKTLEGKIYSKRTQGK